MNTVGSMVVPDFEDTRKSVRPRSRRRSSARTWAGTVESRISSGGNPGSRPKERARTRGHRLEPPMPSTTTASNPPERTSRATRRKSAPCRRCSSTTSSQSSHPSSPLEVHSEASRRHRRSVRLPASHSESVARTCAASAGGRRAGATGPATRPDPGREADRADPRFRFADFAFTAALRRARHGPGRGYPRGSGSRAHPGRPADSGPPPRRGSPALAASTAGPAPLGRPRPAVSGEDLRSRRGKKSGRLATGWRPSGAARASPGAAHLIQGSREPRAWARLWAWGIASTPGRAVVRYPCGWRPPSRRSQPRSAR